MLVQVPQLACYKGGTDLVMPGSDDTVGQREGMLCSKTHWNQLEEL